MTGVQTCALPIFDELEHTLQQHVAGRIVKILVECPGQHVQTPFRLPAALPGILGHLVELLYPLFAAEHVGQKKFQNGPQFCSGEMAVQQPDLPPALCLPGTPLVK